MFIDMTGYPVLNCSARKRLRLSPLFVLLLLIFARVPVAEASDSRSLFIQPPSRQIQACVDSFDESRLN